MASDAEEPEHVPAPPSTQPIASVKMPSMLGASSIRSWKRSLQMESIPLGHAHHPGTADEQGWGRSRRRARRTRCGTGWTCRGTAERLGWYRRQTAPKWTRHVVMVMRNGCVLDRPLAAEPGERGRREDGIAVATIVDRFGGHCAYTASPSWRSKTVKPKVESDKSLNPVESRSKRQRRAWPSSAQAASKIRIRRKKAQVRAPCRKVMGFLLLRWTCVPPQHQSKADHGPHQRSRRPV